MSDVRAIGMITGDLNETRTGIGTYIHHLIEELKDKYAITVIKHESGMEWEGCDSYTISTPYKRQYNSLLWARGVRRHLERLDGLVLIHNPGQFLISPPRKIPTVVTVHDITPILFPAYHFPFRTWTNRLFLPGAILGSDQIITVSYHTREDICTKYRVAKERVHVVHNAADATYRPLPPAAIQEWRERAGLKEPYILFVGTMEPRKNITTLIKAFSQIADSFPTLNLVFAGGRGWRSDPIFAAIERSPHKERIRYLSYVRHEDLPALYNGASVFVFPSWYEGFGLPPLEAMQCGCPTITSDTSSLPEVVGPDGIICTPDDPGQFARAISRIIEDQEYRSRQIAYGKQRSSQFSWKKTAEMTAEIYELALQRNR